MTPQNLEAILTFDGAEDLFQDLMERYAIHSGVSGMQPKVLLRGAGPELERVTERGATHIVKSFDSRRYPELAADEYFCLQAAGHAGMATARARLAENRRILIVDRFDMTADGRYLGCEDFCVLNALRAHGRYSCPARSRRKPSSNCLRWSLCLARSRMAMRTSRTSRSCTRMLKIP
jgi:serine/threonine-protein kinase HipA